MKKPLVLALILAIVTGTTAFAERTLSLGVGYAMNNTNFTNDFGVSQDYSMNGVCVALDTANSLGNLPISFFRHRCSISPANSI